MVALVAGGVPVIVVAVLASVPTYGVIVYLVIWLPPLDGAVQVTVALSFPAAAVTPVGAEGAVGAVGVTAFEAGEAGPEPLGFDACTLNV